MKTVYLLFQKSKYGSEDSLIDIFQAEKDCEEHCKRMNEEEKKILQLYSNRYYTLAYKVK